jgi:hypothetical protein
MTIKGRSLGECKNRVRSRDGLLIDQQVFNAIGSHAERREHLPFHCEV